MPSQLEEVLPATSSINNVPVIELTRTRSSCLDIDALQPFDVILTYGPTKGSKLITQLSEPPYSHASLVLSKTLMFEADREGLFPTFLYPSRIEVNSDGQERRLLELDRYERIGVFRLPELVSYSSWAPLLNLFYMELELLHGDPYPSIPELAHASCVPVFLQKSFIAVAKILTKAGINAAKESNSLFCSALVVAVYQALGFELFPTLVRPETVSPTALGRSRLRPVKNALKFSDDAAKLDENLGRHFRMTKLIGRMDISRSQLYQIGRDHVRNAQYTQLANHLSLRQSIDGK